MCVRTRAKPATRQLKRAFLYRVCQLRGDDALSWFSRLKGSVFLKCEHRTKSVHDGTVEFGSVPAKLTQSCVDQFVDVESRSFDDCYFSGDGERS
jgi:hypothetical protein